MTDETAVRALMAARAALEIETPMVGDCGRMCGAVCCQPDSDGRGGMLLFPGERALYENASWARLERDDSVEQDGTLLVCAGTCPRVDRPLACRLFPLILEIRDVQNQSRLSIKMDARARVVCPLHADGLKALNPEFLKAAERAARFLYSSARQRMFLGALTKFIHENYRLGGKGV